LNCRTLILPAATLTVAAFAAVAALVLAPPLAAQENYRGEVVSVQDGDTITVLTTDFERIRVRFYGIDCPEKNQDHGPQAGDYLRGIVAGKTVDVEVLDTDRYSRQVGLVRLNGTLVNLSMVEAGYAWTYEQYCKAVEVCDSFRRAEAAAKVKKIGLWADPEPVAPWDHRRSKRKRQ
jgi:endonuclease YncB( thermonuclease family)